MKTILAILILMFFSTIAKSQTVARIEQDDVNEASAHPECSGRNLTVDNKAMPENSSEDLRVTSYMRQFRAYRRQGNKQGNQNMMIHINDNTFKADGRIREVTPSYFHIETSVNQENRSYCFYYTQITQVNYDSNGNLHISVRQ